MRITHPDSSIHALMCGVCLTLPSGEVHQCNEGHCYCVKPQKRVATLEPLVRALEVNAEEGERRQRQRVGAPPHDAPLSSAAVKQIGGVAEARVAVATATATVVAMKVVAVTAAVETAVAALRTHVVVAQWEEACARVAVLCVEEGNRQLEAVTAVMRAHPLAVCVQQHGCAALGRVCDGTDAAAPARKQRAVAAGAIEAVVAAMHAHPQVVGVQEQACQALGYVCRGTDAAAPARKQRAVQAGALQAVVAAMRVHPLAVGVQGTGIAALGIACYGTDAAAPARKQRAVELGALDAVVAAVQAHPGGIRCR